MKCGAAVLALLLLFSGTLFRDVAPAARSACTLAPQWQTVPSHALSGSSWGFFACSGLANMEEQHTFRGAMSAAA